VRRATLLGLAVLLATAPPAGAQGGRPVVGGGSFNTAPLLEPGSYTDTVAAGETVYWKIALAKGQVLTATATVDTSAIEEDVSDPDYDSGLAYLDYRLDLHSPLREPLYQEYPDARIELEGDSGAGAVRGTATGPRTLGYEQILGSDFAVDKFPAPGESFVSLSAADDQYQPASVPAELPVKLELRVEGAPQPSSPDFASKLAQPPKPAPEETDTTKDPDAPAPVPAITGGADAGDPALTIALVAVIALLGGLGLGALARLSTPRRVGP